MTKRKSSGSKGVALKSPPKKKKRQPAAAKPRAASIYAVHPSVAMVQKWVADLKVKTGRNLDEWIEHIKEDGPATTNECGEWLKRTYSLGTNAALLLAEKAFDPLAPSEDTPEGYLALAPQYVEQMYAGPKAALKPLHDELVRLTQLLGEDIRICPCKTMVPLYRRHVFAQIRPVSPKRINLGFALGEEPFTSRLCDTGGLAKKDRITHSVALTSLSDIDLQVKRWLKQAYERDA